MMKGRCVCGACSYALDYASMPLVYACHCLDCQTMSGSGFTLQAPVLSLRLKSGGEMISWMHEGRQGGRISQCFCANCKTRLFSTNENRPGVSLVRAGTLDNSSVVMPAVPMWVKRKLAWIGLPEDAERYDKDIPTERIKTLFAANFA